MRWIRRTAIGLAMFCMTSSLAGADTAGTPIGKVVENFSLPDYHGKTYSLDDYKDRPVVLAFLGTECPLALKYAARLRDLAAAFEQQGVVFLGIDANVQDSLTEIGAFARINRITFPLLKDNNNELADRLGAQRTPEVFLLDRARVIRYCGRIDDQYGLKTGGGYAKPKLTEDNLADAIRQVLAGQPVSRPVVKAHGCLIGRVAKITPHGEVTYTKHVARIMQDRCVSCHRPNEVAPFALTSYDEVLGWGATIREVVQEGRMPPWFADPRFGHFANDARLSDEEKRLISTWVDNGCPQGDLADLPTPRKFAEGWQMGQPDQVVYMSEQAVALPAEGAIELQRFTVDPGWTTAKWIQATEVRPGNRAVVHHIRVDIQPEDVSDAFPREGIGTFVPGSMPNIYPPGTAVYVPAGSRLLFEMHYTPNGTPQEDRSMIGIRFADPREIKKIVRCTVVNEQSIRIPPGEPNHEVRTKHIFLKDTLLLGLWPHMHLRGKSFKFEAESPDGSTEVLLLVPNYDFNWQYRYLFAEPKLLPKGTVMKCTAHFDNSTANPANPDPRQFVTAGNQSWQEMMQGNYYAIDAASDVACIALVALSLAAGPDAPAGSEPAPEAKK
jgi:peroxiredoxin/mono/diheme cytochrome c family protein